MKAKKVGALLLAAAMAVCTVPVHGMAAEEGTKTPKYIFLFIGDGMSYPQVQTTNYYLNAIADDGDEILNSESKLNMMKFPVAGSAQTYDSTSFCPDSASTATSISTGHKTYSGTINMDEKMETSYETIAEKLKKQLGYKVGILSSVNLNHATPAAFYAHQASRNSYYEIGEELIASDFDYFAGGGLKKTTGADGDKTDLYQLAEEAGYKVIKTQAEAESLTAEDGKAIVIDETLADSDAMSYDMDREEGEWGLSDYVEKGIEVLDNETGQEMILNLGHYKRFADAIGKPLMVGEVGVCPIVDEEGYFDNYDDVETARPFFKRQLDEIVDNGILLSYWWTYSSDRPQDEGVGGFSLKKGSDDELLGMIIEANQRLKAKYGAA